MSFELVDRYLLGEPVSKADVIEGLLASRSPAPAAAPFYRALEAVGARAADEALIALRLVLAGKEPDDDGVRRLRAISNVARASALGDGRGYAALLDREKRTLRELPELRAAGDLAAAGHAARQAYAQEIRATESGG